MIAGHSPKTLELTEQDAAQAESIQFPRLVVFADDWGRHPSSCQYLVRCLMPECDVTWVNTIGTRPPRLGMTTIVRGMEKAAQWLAGRQRRRQSCQRGPRVLNPLMWPSFASTWRRRLNCKLLTRFLTRNIVRLEETVMLTTLPIVADLVGAIPAKRWVYYCVDDFAVWPGLDAKTLKQMEDQLVARADRFVAAGQPLAESLRRRGADPRLITHGVDLDHWAVTDDGAARELPCLRGLERPLVLFWGLIDRRLDLEILHAIGHTLSAGSIVLVGPEQEPDPDLMTVPRLHRVGPLSVNELPLAAVAASVLIMPYADLAVTRMMQPLKLKEYMATGRPVVARGLPAVKEWSDCVDLVDDPADFARVVCERIETGLPTHQRHARGRLTAESWAAKADEFRQVLFGDADSK